MLWQHLRNNQLGQKVRRQHAVGEYIVDFIFINSKLAIEVDGEYHNEKEQQDFDIARTAYFNELGFDVLRFTNAEVENNIGNVVSIIKERLKIIADALPSPLGEGPGVRLRAYTTRPDTIFGVDFMVIAPEHELVDKIKSAEQTAAVDEYIAYVKSRSERERMAEKKSPVYLPALTP
uniref:endonuclease domain-containing protein n=1 Tax=Niabella ginsengisoli TaxID=522298 RepID=UPI00374CF453